ncbi:class I poly(R)-hydroxyalkanoic acid synthase [uncultured Cohaesibacter sp.]|uniref:PHA/PHB synthase family protein n=1 Tax=uncultured Cohaesibacter sp. TaxID=1002546 RepID=UPI0029316FE6|nr:class I poly(R)-hydroxyalkanoic acid synthase [uncultured Cohaesibacter sp.]
MDEGKNREDEFVSCGDSSNDGRSGNGSSSSSGSTWEYDPDKLAISIARIAVELGQVATSFLTMRNPEREKQVKNFANPMTKAFAHVVSYWMSDPERASQAQMRLFGQYLELYGQLVRRRMGREEADIVTCEKGDKRFDDPAWTSNAFFNFTKQLYLMTCRWANDILDETADIDEHMRLKAKFYLLQILSAISPSNFILTNPELLRETIDSGGENVINGLKLLSQDILNSKGELPIRQTDQTAFTIGETIAVTPGKVIAQNDLCQLIQYEAQTERVIKTPLVIFSSWINKYYILDLTPQKSFVDWCVKQGHTVFVVSWVNPDESLRDKDFFSYMHEGILFSLDHVRNVTGEDKVNVAGYCVGGTLLAATLAYLAANELDYVKSATFFASQVDFTEAGDLRAFVDAEQMVALDELMDVQGFLDASSMTNVFNMLRPNDLIWPYLINYYLRGIEPSSFDFLYWNADATRMAAACHSYYLRKCYLENALARGKMEVDGTFLQLEKVTVPIYCLAAREDHIAPARSIYKGFRQFGGPVDFVLTGSGHISGVVNPPSRNKYQYWRADPSPVEFDDWLRSAHKSAGSWWTDWQAWIERCCPDRVDSRSIGGTVLQPLEEAPGSYVRVCS